MSGTGSDGHRSSPAGAEGSWRLDFGQRLADRVRQVGSPTCVGLDPHVDRLPPALVRGTDRAALAAAASVFCRGVVDAVADRVAAVKPQVAFFEALGSPGVGALEEVVASAREAGLIVVLDAKRGDIGSTAEAYARATLDDDGPLGADAVTLNPWLGPESLAPFVRRCSAGKGLFVLVRTSNPGAGPWQLPVASDVAAWIEEANAAFPGGLGPVGAVVGATLGAEATRWRAELSSAWLLVPGYGAQGAGAAEIRRHVRDDGLGALIVSARGVLFPPTGSDEGDWQDAVRRRADAFVADVAGALPGSTASASRS